MYFIGVALSNVTEHKMPQNLHTSEGTYIYIVVCMHDNYIPMVQLKNTT